MSPSTLFWQEVPRLVPGAVLLTLEWTQSQRNDMIIQVYLQSNVVLCAANRRESVPLPDIITCGCITHWCHEVDLAVHPIVHHHQFKQDHRRLIVITQANRLCRRL